MITHLQGRLVEKHPTAVVIDCNGVGYWVNISLNTYATIGSEETLKLYTHLQVREDAHTLYGFYQSIEREVFRLLLSVSGIGANTARTVLSSMTSSEVCHAIESENVTAIQAVKGIGLKTAQRVIIDLKDKISGISDSSEILSAHCCAHRHTDAAHRHAHCRAHCRAHRHAHCCAHRHTDAAPTHAS